jgi:hypothetical protein
VPPSSTPPAAHIDAAGVADAHVAEGRGQSCGVAFIQAVRALQVGLCTCHTAARAAQAPQISAVPPHRCCCDNGQQVARVCCDRDPAIQCRPTRPQQAPEPEAAAASDLAAHPPCRRGLLVVPDALRCRKWSPWLPLAQWRGSAPGLLVSAASVVCRPTAPALVGAVACGSGECGEVCCCSAVAQRLDMWPGVTFS